VEPSVSGAKPPHPLHHEARTAKDLPVAPALARLKLPPTHDKSGWSKIDKLLSDALAVELPATFFDSASSSDIASKLSKTIHSVLSANFTMEEKVDKKPGPVEKPNKRMAQLRKEKRELKKARQLLHRSGCKGTSADKANSRRWFEVMREHSRLRRVLALRAGAKVSSRELARFKRDPMKFGKQLFEKKLSGDPTFTSDAGFDYFSKLYAEPSRADL
jgi:hypothetical protein